MVGTSRKPKSAVALLVINQIPDLPALAVNSILQNSALPIYIGTVRDQDRIGIPKNDRIHYVDLSLEASKLSIAFKGAAYESFEEDAFFSIVQLKWVLFRKVSEINEFDFLIYNDIDVFWLRPVLPDLLAAFDKSPSTQVMIQHFSWIPGQPQLCMGFVAFRSGKYVNSLIKKASVLHAQMLEKNPRSGDDDVITEIYRMEHFPLEIQLLPQTTFPVGNLLNLFAKRAQFPGLHPFTPYIFHANFVEGLAKKLMITRIAYRQHDLSFSSVQLRKRLLLRLKMFIYRAYSEFRRIVKPQ